VRRSVPEGDDEGRVLTAQATRLDEEADGVSVGRERGECGEEIAKPRLRSNPRGEQEEGSVQDEGGEIGEPKLPSGGHARLDRADQPRFLPGTAE
jgi:hypothetical protein